MIVRERIKAGQLPALDAILNKRIGKAEKQAQHEAEIASATIRLESATARLPELEDEELEKALSDAELAWGKHSPETRELRSKVSAVREQRASAKTGEQEHTGEPATTTATGPDNTDTPVEARTQDVDSQTGEVSEEALAA